VFVLSLSWLLIVFNEKMLAKTAVSAPGCSRKQEELIEAPSSSPTEEA
jgi:hypothetical protein